MRALVVGYGSIARRHLDNLQTANAASEYVVFRPGGRPSGAPSHLRFVSKLSEGLAGAPDFAVVASPSSAHIESLFPLLEARVPCYVEKPPVTTLADVKRLRKLLASQPPPVTQTGCNLRFLPSLQRMRQLMRAGAIGHPVRASIQAGQWLPDWRPGRDYRTSYSANANAGGGVILDLIHEIDAARWLFGEFDELRSLSAKLSDLQIDSEDTACLLLGRQGGPITTVGLDYVSRRRMRRYEVVGDRGTLVWDLSSMRLTLDDASGSTVLDAEPINFDVGMTYVTAMREFLAAMQAKRPTAQDLLDGLATNELALKAKRGSG